jgi:two-component system, NarL family, response regulator DevR
VQTHEPGSDGAPGRQEPLRVFILDDHELVRQGLRELLEGEGFVVVGESGSATEATRRIPALKPDIAILDGRLPDGTGIEVCRDVRSLDPRLRCVILTSYDDEQAIRGAVLAGASGYILKQIRSNALLAGILKAAAGESLFEPGVEQRIMAGLSKTPTDPRMEALSPQEKKVLALIGQGLTNRQIGGELFLAEKTVKNYVSSILAKLGFERRTQAAVYVTRNSQDPPAEPRRDLS